MVSGYFPTFSGMYNLASISIFCKNFEAFVLQAEGSTEAENIARDSSKWYELNARTLTLNEFIAFEIQKNHQKNYMLAKFERSQSASIMKHWS